MVYKQEIKMRNESFKNLFSNILSVNFAEDWECVETNDDSVNPLVIFRTRKWRKLHNLVKSFVDTNKRDYDNNTSEFDLIVGSLTSIQYKIESNILSHN